MGYQQKIGCTYVGLSTAESALENGLKQNLKMIYNVFL